MADRQGRVDVAEVEREIEEAHECIHPVKVGHAQIQDIAMSVDVTILAGSGLVVLARSVSVVNAKLGEYRIELRIELEEHARCPKRGHRY